MISFRPWKAIVFLLLRAPYSALGDNNLGAIEEAPQLPNGFSPRFFDSAFPAQPFARRQDSETCPSGGHSCAEIGDVGASKCCAADSYCYYKADWEVGCCGFGTTCDPVCTSTSYRTNATVVTTTTFTGTTSDISTTGTVFVESTFTTTFVGCVARACAVTQYKCPSSMGGGCCDNSQVCASNTQCLATVSTTPTLVATRGCSGTPSATDCPSGGGCCIKGQTCVAIDGTLGCSGTADPPAGANVTTSSGGLSQGAKAGIGAGVAVGAAIVIGALTWFCIKRRRDAQTAGNRTRSGGPTPGPESTVAGGGGEMSEASGPSRGRRHQTGLVYEYLGPNAVPGPYTMGEDTLGDPSPGLPDHGVPRSPQEPSDIRPPVEMADSSEQVKTLGDVRRGASTRSRATTGSRAVRSPGAGEQDDTVYELEASFPEPSPLSPDELPSAQSYHTPMSPAGPISPPGGTMRTDYLG